MPLATDSDKRSSQRRKFQTSGDKMPTSVLLRLFTRPDRLMTAPTYVTPLPSARPTEPLVQFSRKRLSMGVALLAVAFAHAGNQLQNDQVVFTVEACLR